jgi:hypothetical protein
MYEVRPIQFEFSYVYIYTYIYVGPRIFSKSSREALRPTQPPIQWVPGDLSLRIKKQEREADHSPPTSAEVKKIWIYTPTSQYAFMA